MNRPEKGNTQVAFSIQASICSQIFFTKDFDRDLIVRPENVAAGGAQRRHRHRVAPDPDESEEAGPGARGLILPIGGR